MTLLATVRNRDGGIVSDLNLNDFVLEEDGRPQTIRYFSRVANLLLTIGLLVDTSRSQRQVLEPERKVSYAFLHHTLRKDDQAFVASFDVEVQMLQGLTNSRELLSRALDQLRIPTRVNTLLFDAIHETSDDVMSERQGRKAFILLSDGVDAGSGNTFDSAIYYAQRAESLIYSIWFHEKWPLWKLAGDPIPMRVEATIQERGKATVEQVSRETGGRSFEVPKTPIHRKHLQPNRRGTTESIQFR